MDTFDPVQAMATCTIDEPITSIPLEDYMKPPDIEAEFAKLPLPTNTDYKTHHCYYKTKLSQSIRITCYMESGNTQLFALLMPPDEPFQGFYNESEAEEEETFDVTVKYSIFATRSRETIPTKEAALSCFVKTALASVLCTQSVADQAFQIRIVVLQDDGCIFSTAVNACILACIDGGVAIFQAAAASTVALYKNHLYNNPNTLIEELIKAINFEEAQEDYGIISTVTMLPEVQITGINMHGSLSLQTLRKLRNRSLMLNKYMLNIMQKHCIRNVCNLVNIDEKKFMSQIANAPLRRKLSSPLLDSD